MNADRRAPDGAQGGGARSRGRWSATPTGSRARPRSRAETLVISTTATARARPTAPRRALRNQTERKDRWDTSRWARAEERTRPPFPGGGRLTGSAPAASSAASATISVAIPSAAGVEARIERSRRCSRIAGELEPGIDGEEGCGLRFGQREHIGLEIAASISWSSTRGAFSDRLDLRRIAHRVTARRHRSIRPSSWSVSATCSVIFGRRSARVDQCSSRIMAALLGDPFDPSNELGERHCARRGARRGIWRAGELLAERLQLGR